MIILDEKVLESLADRIDARLFGGGSQKTPATSKTTKKKILSEEAMRCRFISKSRHHCSKRSRGPRFQYRCADHAI